jgi:hypothetical protein
MAKKKVIIDEEEEVVEEPLDEIVEAYTETVTLERPDWIERMKVREAKLNESN